MGGGNVLFPFLLGSTLSRRLAGRCFCGLLVGASLCYWAFQPVCVSIRRKESYEHIYVPIWVGGITISGILAYALVRAML